MCCWLRLSGRVALRLNSASKEMGSVLRSISCINLNGNQDLFQYSSIENDAEVLLLPPSSESKTNSAPQQYLTTQCDLWRSSALIVQKSVNARSVALSKTRALVDEHRYATDLISKDSRFLSPSVHSADPSCGDRSYIIRTRSSTDELVDSTGVECEMLETCW